MIVGYLIIACMMGSLCAIGSLVFGAPILTAFGVYVGTGVVTVLLTATLIALRRAPGPRLAQARATVPDTAGKMVQG